MQTEEMTELEQIEISITQAKNYIELAETLKDLEQDARYKKVFTEYFFKENAIRLIDLKASPHCQDESQQKLIMQQIDMVGQLAQFLRIIRLQGQQAESALEQAEDERVRMLQEDN